MLHRTARPVALAVAGAGRRQVQEGDLAALGKAPLTAPDALHKLVHLGAEALGTMDAHLQQAVERRAQQPSRGPGGWRPRVRLPGAAAGLAPAAAPQHLPGSAAPARSAGASCSRPRCSRRWRWGCCPRRRLAAWCTGAAEEQAQRVAGHLGALASRAGAQHAPRCALAAARGPVAAALLPSEPGAAGAAAHLPARRPRRARHGAAAAVAVQHGELLHAPGRLLLGVLPEPAAKAGSCPRRARQ
jgi:hypothetical protein